MYEDVLDINKNKIEVKTTTLKEYDIIINQKTIHLLNQENDMRNKKKINSSYRLFDYLFLFSYCDEIFQLQKIMNRKRQYCDEQYNIIGD